MSNIPDEPVHEVDPDRIDQALQSFWRGSFNEFEALLEKQDGEEPGVCELLGGVIDASQGAATLPDKIGDYTILRQIGCGGMAVVYEARQQRTGRTVALKVIRGYGGFGDDVRFFRREIDTLARLKHPNIATLHDAGETANGQHYFVMELVAGANLTEALPPAPAGPKPDDLRRRLRLFNVICRAMSYAHQRGIIHCDLKPSNIFVDEQDQPKVLDFGLAQLVDPDRSMVTDQSDTNKIIGTLHYMSPEQARGRIDEIDMRSDVYSLGVILYELLTGQRPYGWRGASLPAMLRDICETPAGRPSAIRRGLRGDLEIIVLKALEKETDRRYQSTAALADDIDRYLADQPILARGPSAAYQLRKFITRHKVSAALTMALVMVATAAGISYVRQAAVVRQQRDVAQSQAQRAEKMSGFLTGMIASVDPREVGMSVQVRDVLDKAAANLDGELSDDLETQASLHDTLGRGYLALRQLDRAERHLRKALEIRQKVFGEHHPAYAASLHQLGLLAVQQGKSSEPERLIRQAYQLRRELLGDQHEEVAESLLALAELCRWNSDFTKAEPLYKEALAITRRLPGEDRNMAECLHKYAGMLVAAGRYEEAEPLLDEALEKRRLLLGNDHLDVARTLTDLCEIYSYHGQYDKVEPLYREQVRILRRAFPDGCKDLATAMSDLAPVVALRGNYAEAESLFREAVGIEEKASGKGNNALSVNNYAAFLREQGRYREAEPLCRDVYRMWHGDADRPHQSKGYACQNLAAVLFELGQYDEAEKLYLDAIATWRALFGSQHPKLANALIGVGRIHETKGNLTKAEQFFREAMSVRRKRVGEDNPETAAASIYLAELLSEEGNPEALDLCRGSLAVIRCKFGDLHSAFAWGLGRLAFIQKNTGDNVEAERSFRAAIDVERRLQRDKHPALADDLFGLAGVLTTDGRLQEAEPLLREALAIRQERLGAKHGGTALAKSALGGVLTALKQYAEAESLLTDSYPIIERQYGRGHAETARAASRLVSLYEAWGKADRAAVWKSK